MLTGGLALDCVGDKTGLLYMSLLPFFALDVRKSNGLDARPTYRQVPLNFPFFCTRYAGSERFGGVCLFF